MAAASSISGGGGPRDDRGKGVLVEEEGESSTAAERRAAVRAERRAAERQAAVLGELSTAAERRAAVLPESSTASEHRAAVLPESSTASERRAAVPALLAVPPIPYPSRSVHRFRNSDGFNFSAFNRIPPQPPPDWPARRAPQHWQLPHHIMQIHGEPPPPPPPPTPQAQFYAYAYRNRFVYLLLFFVYIHIGIGFFLISQHYSYKTKGPYFSGTKGTSYTDATYFTVVSLSSIGFGDIYPVRKTAEIFVCFYIYVGLLLFAVVSVILSRGMHQLERLLIHWYIREWRMQNPNLGGRYLGARICINFLFSLLLTWIVSLRSNLYVAVTSVTTVGFGNQSFIKPLDRVIAFLVLFPAVMVYGRLASLVGDYLGTPLEN